VQGRGVTVLDVDVKGGKDGHDTLDKLGVANRPRTVQQVTTSGGTQEFYRYDPRVKNTAGELGEGLDTRNDDGYVVVPPSTLDSKPYVWLAAPFNGKSFATYPENLIPRTATPAERPQRTKSEWLTLLDGVGQGQRQVTLPVIVGKLYREVKDPDFARELARAWGERCDPPLTEQEVDACCDRIEAKEMAKGSTGDVPADDPGGERYTDDRNAQLLALEAAGQLCHAAAEVDKWYLFDGVRLTLEPKTSVFPFTRSIALRLYAEARDLYAEADRRESELTGTQGNLTGDALATAMREIAATRKRADLRKSGAVRFESRDGKYAAIDLAKAEPALRVKIEQLDAHPLWLNTPSGTLDLATGELHPHRFDDYLTKVAGAAYDPEATCPRWDAFLADVVPDAEVRAFLQRSVGYALTDATSEQCLWFLYGVGRNGKTTFVNAVRKVLGDYAANTKASTLMVKSQGDERRNDVAVLRGARFVSATEAEDGQQLAEALIKEVTGGDPVTARRLYAEFFTFTPTFKIWLAANHKPVIRGTDLGIWRRIHLVPFTVTVDLDKVDRELPAALAAEVSGILNWALAGYRAWQSVGLLPPAAVQAATEAYRVESDPLAEFFEDCVQVRPGAYAVAGELFQRYQRWAEASGYRPMSSRGLGLALKDRGFEQYVSHGQRRWRGLQLLG
jgi:putative DNA primase/helicase